MPGIENGLLFSDGNANHDNEFRKDQDRIIRQDNPQMANVEKGAVLESKIELIQKGPLEAIYWISYTGETKHGPMDSYITVRVDTVGGAMEFENAAGGEIIFFHPEQVEQLERLLQQRKAPSKIAWPVFEGWKDYWIPSGRRGGKKSRLPVGTVEMLRERMERDRIFRFAVLNSMGETNANLPKRTKPKRRAK
jgi:hypothetical protein